MKSVKDGKEHFDEEIDVHNRSESDDLGPTHTSGTPGTRLGSRLSDPEVTD